MGDAMTDTLRDKLAREWWRLYSEPVMHEQWETLSAAEKSLYLDHVKKFEPIVKSLLAEREAKLRAESDALVAAAYEAVLKVATDGRMCSRADHMQDACSCAELRADIALLTPADATRALEEITRQARVEEVRRSSHGGDCLMGLQFGNALPAPARAIQPRETSVVIEHASAAEGRNGGVRG